MKRWWLFIGSPKNWKTAFENGNLWGFKGTQRGAWENIEKDDLILFYTSSPVSGVIGFGAVQSKFVQNIPLWPEEVTRNEVIWPLRIEIRVSYCLPQDTWKRGRISTPELLRRAKMRQSLQLIEEGLAHELLETFPENATQDLLRAVEAPLPTNLHDETKAQLLEIGRLQSFIAEPEYDVEIGKVDVVWRRVARSVPNYVFEVHIAGNLDRDMSKLKHAYDIWNSNIFIVSIPDERGRVEGLLAGAFHEIKDRLTFIDVNSIADLSSQKRDVINIERELGIL